MSWFLILNVCLFNLTKHDQCDFKKHWETIQRRKKKLAKDRIKDNKKKSRDKTVVASIKTNNHMTIGRISLCHSIPILFVLFFSVQLETLVTFY